MRIRYRLVLFYDYSTRYKAPPHGSLYDVDAGPYALPVWTFALSPNQQLPFVEPGAIVEMTHEPAGGSVPSFRCGGAIIQPVAGLEAGSGPGLRRLFAQRNDLIAHPGTMAARPPSALPSVSFTPGVVLHSQMKRAGRGLARTAVVVAALAAVLWIWNPHNNRTDSGSRWLAVLWFAFAAALAWSSWTALRRSRRYNSVLTRPTVTGQAMLMQLTWLAGYGNGPLAGPMLDSRLHPMGSSFPLKGGVRVRLIDVPAELVSRELAEVRAHLDDCGEVYAIEWGEHLMRPAPDGLYRDDLVPKTPYRKRTYGL